MDITEPTFGCFNTRSNTLWNRLKSASPTISTGFLMVYQKLIKWIADQKYIDYVVAREELGQYFISFRGRYTKSQVEKAFKYAYSKDRSVTSYERFKKSVEYYLSKHYG